MSTTSPQSLRASDTDRESTVSRLHRALGDGFLDLDETDERIATAYAARFRGELEPLVADLPHHTGAAPGPPAWAEVWTSAVWRGRVTLLGDAPDEPTGEQTRTAALVVALVALWLVVCAFLGALL